MRSLPVLLATLAAVVGLAAPVGANPGELDASFGSGGLTRTDLGGTYDWAFATAVQPDGGILAAGVSNGGGTHDFALARYTPERSLDPRFGEGGIVTTDFGDSFDWAYAMALQPDGRIVVGGVTDRTGSRDFALARYEADGGLDESFADGGLAVGGLRQLSVDQIHGLAVAPDGHILVAGVTYDEAASLGPHGDFMLARYTPDGQPDPTFGVGGVVTTGFEPESYDVPYALALQRDGKILLGGYSNSGGGPGVLFGADQLALARYTRLGVLDSTFGDGGKMVLDAGSLDEEIRALSLTRDGRVLAAGFVNGERRGDMLLARFTPDGRLDSNFGEGGLSVTDLGSRSEQLNALVVQPDGRIVAGGQVATGAHADFAVLRYDPSGRLDPSYGQDGLVAADFGGREDRIHALALQRDGKVVAVGQSEADFALVRLTGS